MSPVISRDIQDNRLFVEIKLYNKPFKALLDSGAQASLISQGLIDELNIHVKTHCHPLLVSADNSPINILGTADILITFNNKSLSHEFFVSNNVSSDIILGMEFWNYFGLTSLFSQAFEKNIFGNMYVPPVYNCSYPPFKISEVTHLRPRCCLTDDQERQLQKAIDSFGEISSEKKGLGKTSWLSHKINTTGPPIRQRYYPLSPAKLKILNEEIDKMLEAGVIRPSRSPWASPVVMVTKKDGSVRFCVDSRKLNSVTIRDSYPLPRIQDILDNLRGARYMTSLDFRSAFWQIPLADQDSCEKTAFIVPQRGLFEFVRMPFGLTNAASEMQRLTDMIVNYEYSATTDDCIFGYVDDLILVSRDFDSHLKLLDKVRQRLYEAGLTVNLKKCEFCKAELKYLGYIVNEKGLQTDPAKLEAIREFPVPSDAKSLRGFIGVCSYYRRFVNNFSSIIAPLTALLGKKKGRDSIEWNISAQEAFEKLKQALLDTPVIACPDFSKPFMLHCDASSVGLGSVLTQFIDGEEHPIAFHSRLFSHAERNYSTTERELLAVLDSILHFRCYLDGTKFSIITDHMALKWLLTLNNPSGRLARWSTLISQYTFDIVHRKGSQNVVPDALSRFHVSVITYADGIQNTNDRWYKKIFLGVQNHPQMFSAYMIDNGQLLRRMPIRDPLSQNAWRVVLPVEKIPAAINEAHSAANSIHPGVMKTYLKLKDVYYWPNMFHDVTEALRQCETCKSFKISNCQPRGVMSFPRNLSRPMQMLSIDLIGPLPRAYYGFKYILSMVDVFTKYVWLKAFKKIDAKAISEALESEVFFTFGIPNTVACDNASVFRSSHFSNFLNSYNVHAKYTPYYSPQSNPVERYNQNVVTCLSILVGDNQRSWARLLPKVKLYLNSSINLATSYTPNFLMFGRELTLDNSSYRTQGNDAIEAPTQGPSRQTRDLRFVDSQTTQASVASPSDHLSRNRVQHANNLNCLDAIFAKVSDNLTLSFLRNARDYNKNRAAVTLNVGDTVWRRNFTRSSGQDFTSGKFAPRFIRARVSKIISNQVYELQDFDSPYFGTYHIKDILK